MFNRRTPDSIRDVVQSVTTSVWVFAGSLFIGLALLFSFLILSNSHAALCSMVNTKLESISGPLSRELALGAESTSRAIFADFTQELIRADIKQEIRLETLSSEAPGSGTCVPHFFYARLHYPLRFASVNQAIVTGTLSYFSISKILLVVGLILLFLFVLSRTLLSRLMRELGDRIIAPVLALSKGEALPPGGDIFPREVREIHENMDGLKKEIQENARVASELSKTQAIAMFASRAAHDIRSPVTALSMLASDGIKISEEQRRILLRSATSRIQDIANDLLVTRRKLLLGACDDELKETSTCLVVEAIESVISEKRTEFHSRHGLQIDALSGQDAYGLFVRVELSEFKRIISNLVNNAIEAVDTDGKIVVTAERVGPLVQIVVEDNGKGMEESRIGALMTEGAKSDKPTGHGLGLLPANDRLNEWGGQIRLSSTPGKGTRVAIELPAVPAPVWFVQQLEITPLSSVVVCDDDITIHHVWDDRLRNAQAAENGIEITHVSSGAELKRWHARLHKSSTLYLIDYELAERAHNGLELTKDLGIETQAILVTSRHEEVSIVEECVRLGIKLLPKSSASVVPLMIREQAGLVDGILIEDDEALGIAWKSSAESRGKRLQVFRSAAPFLSIAHSVDRQTPIYLDANLGSGERGEEVGKHLHAMGFDNLYLTTGETVSQSAPWFRAVLDKTPPWVGGERLFG